MMGRFVRTFDAMLDGMFGAILVTMKSSMEGSMEGFGRRFDGRLDGSRDEVLDGRFDGRFDEWFDGTAPEVPYHRFLSNVVAFRCINALVVEQHCRDHLLYLPKLYI